MQRTNIPSWECTPGRKTISQHIKLKWDYLYEVLLGGNGDRVTVPFIEFEFVETPYRNNNETYP